LPRRPAPSRLRALAALALVFALTGCMKVDVHVAINADDTVSGTIVMAVDKRLASLTGKSQDQLVSTITLQPDTVAPGTTVEPYEDDSFVGRRYLFANVPLSQFHGTDQVPVTLAHEGRRYFLTGVADLRTVNLADPAVQRFADLFTFTVSVTFPGKIVESTGGVPGRTVTWTLKAGQPQPMHASAETPGTAWWPWLLGAGVFLVVVMIVIGVVVLSRRHPPTTDEPTVVGI